MTSAFANASTPNLQPPTPKKNVANERETAFAWLVYLAVARVASEGNGAHTWRGRGNSGANRPICGDYRTIPDVRRVDSRHDRTVSEDYRVIRDDDCAIRGADRVIFTNNRSIPAVTARFLRMTRSVVTDEAWRGAAVTDNAIAQVVRALRELLGPQPDIRSKDSYGNERTTRNTEH